MKLNQKKYSTIAVLCGTLVFMGACSSSNKGEGDELSFDEIPTFEASTDEVPFEESGDEFASMDELAPLDEAPPLEAAPADDMMASFDEPPALEPAAMTEPAPVPAMDEMAYGDAPAAEPYYDSASSYEMPTSATPLDTGSTGYAATGSGQYETYVFQSGDTLMKIAFETYGDVYKWQAIYDLNRDKITNPNHIAPGTVIQIEKPAVPVVIERNGDAYQIKVGDTLRSISTDIYGTPTKWRKLWDNNRQLIKDPNLIFAGFYLYYTITPQEQQEAEMLRQQLSPAPVADGGLQMQDSMVEAPRDPAADQMYQ